MEKIITKVNPIIIYPKCILDTGMQDDCNTCLEKDICTSPRSMCVRPYKNHKCGCPNYGKSDTCPPKIPSMYDQIFYVDDVYAVITKFNLYKYYERRRKNRPDLPEGQIRNLRCWQPITIKENDMAVSEFYNEYADKNDYVSTRLLECMGVDVINTLKEVGVTISFPIEEYVYRVSFLAKTIEESLSKYNFEIYEDKNKHIKTLKKVSVN